MWKRIPPYFRNFYILTLLIFTVWMTFFDSNDWITRFKLSSKLSELEAEKEYYAQKIEEVEKDQQELMGTPELLEKFAREKYLMRRPGEDVFVIREKE